MEGNKFVVIGVGRYGRQIALKLAKKGAEVYCFDFSEDKIEGLKDEVAITNVDLTTTKSPAVQALFDALHNSLWIIVAVWHKCCCHSR